MSAEESTSAIGSGSTISTQPTIGVDQKKPKRARADFSDRLLERGKKHGLISKSIDCHDVTPD